MSHNRPLLDWIRTQYEALGTSSSGQPVGKKKFKDRLIKQRIISGGSKKEKQEIRQYVNWLYSQTSTTSNTMFPFTATTPQLIAPLKRKNSIRSAPIATSSRSGQFKAPHNIEYDSGISLRSSPSKADSEVMHASTSENHDTSQSSSDKGKYRQRHLNAKIRELKEAAGEVSRGKGNDEETEREGCSLMPALEDQLQLLSIQDQSGRARTEDFAPHNIINAVLFSPEVVSQYGSRILPQYSLLAGVCPDNEIFATEGLDPRLFLNTNIPFSAFICGLQGSGKSHTLSTLLENCLIQSPTLGMLQRPLSALIFHFGQYTSRSAFWPCEAAFLAHPHPEFRDDTGIRCVNVLAAPSNYRNLSESYNDIPGIKIQPFKLRSSDLNIRSMLTLMSVDQNQKTPLYMGQITRILREIAGSPVEEFDYKAFKEKVESCPLSKDQKCFLEQRLELLESFLDLENPTPSHHFGSGSITIVDLSCPFVDANTACALFNIYMSVYLESNPSVGKVIAVDEAHKYMTDTPGSKAFTESLLAVIRQQRHIGARVIISTQEPSISPRLIDLCSILIIHRFSSPEWFDIIRKHISVNCTDQAGITKLFRVINSLRVGEGLLFAPSTILNGRNGDWESTFQLSSNLLKIKMRNRVTWDGGKSLVCV